MTREMNSKELQKKAETFLDSLFKRMKETNLTLAPHWDIDHLCFRVESLEDYDDFKLTFSNLGRLLTETSVNGRPISTFELNTPITYKDWLVHIVELPAPKKGKKTKTGFEHMEVVIDCSMEELIEKNKKIEWDKSGMEKIFNSELEANFNDMAVKFHHLSLKSVINFELRPKMAILLSELKLFEMFKEHQPFVAGTIPLAIDLEGADIDFLITFPDPLQFGELCKQGFSLMPEFELSTGEIKGNPYCLCRFEYRSLPVELFCSSVSTYKQNAFLHFQIEEKLLKYGPVTWHNDVISLKNRGLKTEPAFAKLLNYTETDAYSFLLDLQKKPIKELRQLVRGSLN